ncbi:MAG: sulfotransferase family protein [Egibacteraceae bacterium]
MTLRLAVWSGPRNVSTALMYAFAQRGDTRVLDEPLYAAYLARGEALDHPGREEVLSAQHTDAERVIEECLLGPCSAPVLMAKHMAHHLRGLEDAHGDGWPFLAHFTNVLLTRAPRAMLASLAAKLAAPDLADTGLVEQVAVLESLVAVGETPIVITAEQVLADPTGALTALCARVGIDFDPGMMSWLAGPKPYDGVWARHWYAGVHRSTGLSPLRATPRELPAALEPLLAVCEPLHARLAAHVLGG